MRFVTRRQYIDASPTWTGTNTDEIAAWLDSIGESDFDIEAHEGDLIVGVRTWRSPLVCRPSQHIVQDIESRHYSVWDTYALHATYEKVEQVK